MQLTSAFAAESLERFRIMLMIRVTNYLPNIDKLSKRDAVAATTLRTIRNLQVLLYDVPNINCC